MAIKALTNPGGLARAYLGKQLPGPSPLVKHLDGELSRTVQGRLREVLGRRTLSPAQGWSRWSGVSLADLHRQAASSESLHLVLTNQHRVKNRQLAEAKLWLGRMVAGGYAPDALTAFLLEVGARDVAASRSALRRAHFETYQSGSESKKRRWQIARNCAEAWHQAGLLYAQGNRLKGNLYALRGWALLEIDAWHLRTPVPESEIKLSFISVHPVGRALRAALIAVGRGLGAEQTSLITHHARNAHLLIETAQAITRGADSQLATVAKYAESWALARSQEGVALPKEMEHSDVGKIYADSRENAVKSWYAAIRFGWERNPLLAQMNARHAHLNDHIADRILQETYSSRATMEADPVGQLLLSGEIAAASAFACWQNDQNLAQDFYQLAGARLQGALRLMDLGSASQNLRDTDQVVRLWRSAQHRWSVLIAMKRISNESGEVEEAIQRAAEASGRAARWLSQNLIESPQDRLQRRLLLSADHVWERVAYYFIRKEHARAREWLKTAKDMEAAICNAEDSERGWAVINQYETLRDESEQQYVRLADEMRAFLLHPTAGGDGAEWG